MRAFGGWVGAGLVGLVAVVATPASAQGRAAPEAVVDAADARAARWVIAARVRLRGAPAADAPILGGVAVNTPLRVDATVGDWCEVATADGRRGFVACRFLGEAAVDLGAISTPATQHGDPNPDYDPARAFSFEPTWSTLETYAYALDRRRRESGVAATPDATLEAMKAELAKGAYGAPPPPRPDFSALQRRVAAVAGDGAPEPARVAAAMQAREDLQLWTEPFQVDAERALAVVASIPLPPVRASWFADERALAAPDDDPEALSGRFGIVHRTLVGKAAAADDNGYDPSLYDIGSRTHLLVRPVQRAVLFADGRLQVAPSHARVRHAALADDHGCAGWHGGFRYGDLAADDPAWRELMSYDPAVRAGTGLAAGSLYAIYVPTALPNARATVSEARHALDREATGFVHATTRLFDVDHDTVPDLLVWEAAGAGPGHFEPTGTDDTWYRLVLVNVGGRWTVLGTDQFSYGCGC